MTRRSPRSASLPPLLCLLSAATLGMLPAAAENPFEDLESRVGSGLEDTTYDHELEVAAPADAGDTPLADALAEAMPMLKKGESVRLKLAPGIFRETLGHVVFTGEAVDAPLAIVGAGSDETIWRGSDAVPADAWEDLGDGLYAMDWPHDWGNWAFPWETPEVIGHRSELVFADGSPLRQVMLETYDYSATGELMDHGSREQTWTYTGFQRSRRRPWSRAPSASPSATRTGTGCSSGWPRTRRPTTWRSPPAARPSASTTGRTSRRAARTASAWRALPSSTSPAGPRATARRRRSRWAKPARASTSRTAASPGTTAGAWA